MLLDTMVISEARKYPHHMDQGVLTFFRTHRHVKFHLSVITLGELYKGHHELLRRGATRKATELLAWIMQLRTQYAGRMIPFGEHDAEQWGEFLGHDPQHQVDKQIAAIAVNRAMVLVTRNIKHMPQPPFVSSAMVINPFSGVLYRPPGSTTPSSAA
jgi:predicted nucleic acid-binding protein